MVYSLKYSDFIMIVLGSEILNEIDVRDIAKYVYGGRLNSQSRSANKREWFLAYKS